MNDSAKELAYFRKQAQKTRRLAQEATFTAAHVEYLVTQVEALQAEVQRLRAGAPPQPTHQHTWFLTGIGYHVGEGGPRHVRELCPCGATQQRPMTEEDAKQARMLGFTPP